MLTTSPARWHGDDGSSLVLMPVAVMIVLLLAAVALDLSIVYVAQRDLLDAAGSAANDAATYGIDPAALQAGAAPRLDPARAVAAVDRSLAVHHVHGLDPTATVVEVDPAAGRVRVALRRHVDYVFAKALPGARRGRDVTAEASASLRQR